MVSDALESERSIESALLLESIIDELASLRLASQYGSIRRKSLVALIAPVVEALGSASTFQNPGRTARLLVESLTSADIFPFGRAFWIAWLFGTWDALLEKARWLETVGIMGISVGVSKDIGPQPKVPNPEDYHRNVCCRFVRQYPECSRIDFTRSEYRSFRWLLHHDHAWLNEMLPITERNARQLLLL